MRKLCKLFCCALFFTAFFLFISCGSNKKSGQVSVAAASDLRFAMDEMIKAFNTEYPDIKINVTYGSSGNLFQQIKNNAPFQIFFAADKSYTKKLDSLKLTGTTPKLYAIGHLVLWSSSIDVSKGPEVLLDENVKKISLANPAVAPYGKRAVECLKYYNLYDKVEEKIVSGENVSQAAQFALSGNADVGIIALSLALSPEMSGKGKYFLIDEKSYKKLEQAYVVIKGSEEDENVMQFVKFTESEAGRKIFVKFGFKLPGEK